MVDDPDAHFAHAAAAGAEVVMELTDLPYGSHQYAARDPEGNMWCFGTYQPAAPRLPDATRAVSRPVRFDRLGGGGATVSAADDGEEAVDGVGGVVGPNGRKAIEGVLRRGSSA